MWPSLENVELIESLSAEMLAWQELDDTRRRNDLVNPLNNNGFKSSSREVIERVCTTIDALHQQLESSESAAS